MQTGNVPRAVPLQGIDDPTAAVRRAVRRPALRYHCQVLTPDLPLAYFPQKAQLPCIEGGAILSRAGLAALCEVR